VLTGGHQHDPAARAAVVAGVEGLHEQQRRAHVDREREVDLPRVELAEAAVDRVRVVDDEDVEVPEGGRGVGDDALRSGRIGEVGAQVDGAVEPRRVLLEGVQREPVAVIG
jgi:hypothetical protein